MDALIFLLIFVSIPSIALAAWGIHADRTKRIVALAEQQRLKECDYDYIVSRLAEQGLIEPAALTRYLADEPDDVPQTVAQIEAGRNDGGEDKDDHPRAREGQVNKQERIVVVAVFTGLVCSLAIIVLLAYSMWQRCSPEFDGRFYGNLDGSVRQCVCSRKDREWRCELVDR